MGLLKECSSEVLIILSILAFLSAPAESANILVIDGVASPSHQIWMRALSFALGHQGHNVTVLSPTLAKDAPTNVHYITMPELWVSMEQELSYDLLAIPEMNPYELLWSFVDMYEPWDQVVLNCTGYKALIHYPRDFQVDLMIFDYLSPYVLASLKEFFNNPPMIAASAYPGIGSTNFMTRGPEFFSFVPNMLKDEVKDCFWDRLDNFLISSLYYIAEQYKFLPSATKSVRKVLPDQVQSIKEVIESSVIQLVNYHAVIDPVHPIMPSVIPVGGLQIAEPKPLPADLEEIYSKESKGTVLFSLGSNVKSELLGTGRLQEIISALAELPEYNFIWKIDVKGLDLELPGNVFIKKWLPQNDMLADNRTVLFISHAGGLSTQECTWFGVPMLALPVMFDQFPNAKRVVETGMGLKLDIRYLKKDVLKATIQTLLTNKEFSRKAQQMSRNFRDQPQKPMERALWWIEYVLRNPNVPFLTSKRLKEMNYVTKHSIDVIAFLTIVVLAVLGVIVRIVVWLIMRGASVKKKVKKQ